MRKYAAMLAVLLAAGPAFAQSQGAIEQSGLVGRLEGPTILTDPAAVPKAFKEAPSLAALVASGKLPPVAQRLPAEPMVVQPLREIGTYGGTWRRGFIGPGDSENGNRLRSGDKLVFFDASGTKLMPSVVRGWEVSADGKRTTLFLRRGMKWSDGTPFTADDFVFWYEDMLGNKDVVPSAPPELLSDGKVGRIEKVNETTVAFVFDSPYFLFIRLVAGDTQVGGGQSRLQADGLSYGLYAPAHYLKQFLPKYSSEAALTTLARNSGAQSWLDLFKQKSDWRLNRDLPTLSAWVMTSPINTTQWVLERNPYFYAVDSAGNQLPYIDRIQMTLSENPDVINLRAIAGEYDYQERFIDLAKLPVLIENAKRSKYKVHLDPGFNGADSVLFPNLTYKGDPEIAKWLGNVDFRRALSLGIDREQLNETFWLGLGTPGSAIPDPIMPETPKDTAGQNWRTKWSKHDPAQANRMLDAIGLSKKDNEGFRLRTDNGQRLRIEVTVAQTLSPTWPQQVEMIAQHWRRIGLETDIKVMERRLALMRISQDQTQMVIWTNNGTESLYMYARYALPVDMSGGMGSRAYAQWYGSAGREGVKPTDTDLLRAYDLMNAATSQQEAERDRIAQEIWKLAVDNQWNIGLVGLSPAFMGVRVVSDRLQNVPERTCISQHCRTPWGAHPEQWFFR
jgi:peptide/nickel transport system substrate-binding protein